MDFEILNNEYAPAFEDAKFSAQSFENLYEMLELVLSRPHDDPDFKNLSAELGDNLIKAQEYEATQSAILTLLARVEVLGKKIICLCDGHLNNVPKDGGHVYLKEVLSYLYLDDKKYTHLKQVKEARKQQIHNAIQLTKKAYFTLLEAIVLTLWQMISAKYNKLKEALCPEENFSKYIEQLEQDYQKNRNVFVELDIKEDIDVLGQENFGVHSNQKVRKGSIAEIRKLVLEAHEYHFMLVGEAGMGKSTALYHLIRMDAKSFNNNKNNKTAYLPVYINLSDIDNDKLTILSEISRVLNRDEKFVADYLSKNKISLFLDGFNEILPKMLEYLPKHIQNFINQYPKTPICIASRPTAYDKTPFSRANQSSLSNKIPIPAFTLQSLEEEQIKDFINKNFKGDKEALNQYLKNPDHRSIRETLNVTLYLAEFLLIFQEQGNVTSKSAIDITKQFLDIKCQRENKLKHNPTAKTMFIEVLKCYARTISNQVKYGFSNPAVDEQDCVELINLSIMDCNAQTHFNNAIELLALSDTMRILVKKGQKYSFAHQSYQDYFRTLFSYLRL